VGEATQKPQEVPRTGEREILPADIWARERVKKSDTTWRESMVDCAEKGGGPLNKTETRVAYGGTSSEEETVETRGKFGRPMLHKCCI